MKAESTPVTYKPSKATWLMPILPAFQSATSMPPPVRPPAAARSRRQVSYPSPPDKPVIRRKHTTGMSLKPGSIIQGAKQNEFQPHKNNL
jgi:hypothetical protein